MSTGGVIARVLQPILMPERIWIVADVTLLEQPRVSPLPPENMEAYSLSIRLMVSMVTRSSSCRRAFSLRRIFSSWDSTEGGRGGPLLRLARHLHGAYRRLEEAIGGDRALEVDIEVLKGRGIPAQVGIDGRLVEVLLTMGDPDQGLFQRLALHPQVLFEKGPGLQPAPQPGPAADAARRQPPSTPTRRW